MKDKPVKLETKEVKLGDLISDSEVRKLIDFLSKRKPGTTVHNTTITWMDTQPLLRTRLVKHGVIKHYAAYVFEFYLGLK